MLLVSPYRANSDKAAGFPPVVLSEDAEVDGERVAGFYCRPERGEYLVGDRFFPLDRGLIVATHDAAVAHEWRHHWQWFHGWEYDGLGWPPRSYARDIRRYFRGSKSEMDALLYEARRVPDPFHEEWFDLIFGAPDGR